MSDTGGRGPPKLPVSGIAHPPVTLLAVAERKAPLQPEEPATRHDQAEAELASRAVEPEVRVPVPEAKPGEARGILGQPIGLRADSLSRVYASGEVSIAALDDISFEIAPGEFVAITGPSGCGKSTLLHLLGGLDRPTSGHVFAAGASLDQLPGSGLDDYRLDRVGTVFQFFNLVPALTAEDNVGLPMALAGVPDQERRQRSQWLLGLVGLDHRARFVPGRLSGGEQQRIAIARALANRPGLILADEPTGNLDSVSGEQVLTLLRELNRRGATVVLVTHDPEVARRSGRVIRLRDGRLASDSGSERQTVRAPLSSEPASRFQPRDAYRMGLQECGRRPLRTVLTAAGAVLGIALASLILSLQAGPASRATGFLALIALVMAGFGIVNTMFTSVVDRTREVGVLKALGARDQDVALLFLAESTLIGAAAAVAGPLLAFLLSVFGNRVAGVKAFALSPGVVGLAVLLAIVLSLISGVLPALRASRMDPARALRSE
jgi:putative ABC transport system ATP-binding protein